MFARAWLFVALILISPGAAQAHRAALIIGNANYASGNRLLNPPNDAQLVASAAHGAGFDVVVANDLNRIAFEQALRDFRAKADGAEIAMIYYAGHGIEGQGKNWLIPVDAKLEEARDLPFEAVDLDRLYETLGGAQIRMVLLDACRNNPFGSTWTSATRSVTRGLSAVEVDGVLVIYAAAAGQSAIDGQGANSPFATSVAKRLVEPGMAVQLLGFSVRDDVLAATQGSQRPFVNASISAKPVYLVEKPQAPAVPIPVQPPTDNGKAQEELVWQSAVATNSIGGYQVYLKAFPDGQHAGAAKQSLDRFVTAVQPVAISPPPANGAKASEGFGAPSAPSVQPATALAAGSAVEPGKIGQGASTTGMDPSDLYAKGASALRAQDYSGAMTLLKIASDQGSIPAKRDIGLMYQEGFGVSRNPEEAVSWLRKAADLGDAEAQNHLGAMLYKGEGSAPDFAASLAWFRKAADQNLPEAQYNVGNMYFRGEGVAKDLAQATLWYKKAADQNFARAQFNLAGIFYNGLGVPQDYAQAFELYRKAALQGYMNAQRSLALCFEHGRGVPIDLNQARAWYAKAAANGDDLSAHWLVDHK